MPATGGALGDAGVGVVALADTPAPGFEVYECVSEHPDQLSECSFDRNDGSGTPALRQAATRIPIAAFVDMNDWICPISRCPPVIGNVLVYRQTSHVTRDVRRDVGAGSEAPAGAGHRAGTGGGIRTVETRTTASRRRVACAVRDRRGSNRRHLRPTDRAGDHPCSRRAAGRRRGRRTLRHHTRHPVRARRCRSTRPAG